MMSLQFSNGLLDPIVKFNEIATDMRVRVECGRQSVGNEMTCFYVHICRLIICYFMFFSSGRLTGGI